MTNEDIIRMARDAGLAHFYDSESHCTGITDARLVTEDKERNDDRLVEMLAPFAALVTAAQRDALLAALKNIDKEFSKHGRQHWPEAVKARAAIAKAEEKA